MRDEHASCGHCKAAVTEGVSQAFAYNVAALPLAALGYLNPLIARAAMALSSLFLVSNSLRLRRFRAQRGQSERTPPAVGYVSGRYEPQPLASSSHLT
jgi:Cu+-exporting ATPase